LGHDVIVLGAGAAGLFCAGMAARRGKSVLVLDHAPNPGAKILISGGGRCNFTNRAVSAQNFVSANPHFCKSALASFTPGDFVALVEAHGIKYHEKRLGQLFCDGAAREILAMLLSLCAGAEIRTGCAITTVSKPGDFRVETAEGAFTAPALVIATGGLAIPKLGATGFAYDIARQFGLAVIPPRPGLVPLTFGDPWLQGLSGVSFDSTVRAGKTSFREQTLITHRGLSGPAILQISNYLAPEGALSLDMLPGQDAYALLRAGKGARPRAELKTVLAEVLPARLAQALAPPGPPMADLPDKSLQALAHQVNHRVLTPTGTEGFAKAEVTLGGVDTAALSSQTMAARAVPGLFIIGEAVDVTGWLGGYNFQWAWSSAYAAARAL